MDENPVQTNSKYRRCTVSLVYTSAETTTGNTERAEVNSNEPASKHEENRRKQRKSKGFPTPSSDIESGSESHNSEEEKETSETPTNCFWIVTKEEENKWVLSNEMAVYASRIFEEYIPDGEIEEKLQAETPVPANLDKVKQVDDFILSVLGRTNQCIASYTTLEKFQNNFFMSWVQFQFSEKNLMILKICQMKQLQLHLISSTQQKKNVITRTGFKLDFISEKKKHTILSHKRFKKSKILAMGKKSCIASTILAAPVFW